MAYKFPWTNYHELNLDWILNTVKELFAKTEKNNAIVTQYDGRLTEVELIADNAQQAAEQAQQNSTAALDLAQNAAQTATQAQQAAGQAQQAAGQAQQAAGQAQQTATQAQQTAQNFDGRIRQAENDAENALQAAQAFDEQVQGAIRAANNANEASTLALTTATETSRELAAQRSTLEGIVSDGVDSLQEAAQNATEEIEATGQSVLDSIPADYTALFELVDKKADVIYNTAAGDIASFNDGADDMKIKRLVVNIEPVQAGSGDPSPDNVRPISGHTGAEIEQTGKNLCEGVENFSIDIDGANVKVTSTTGTCLVAHVKEGQTYSFSNADLNRRLVSYWDEIPSLNDISETFQSLTGTTFTAIKSGLALIYINNAVVSTDSAQIELGSTATAYEPYTGDQISVNWETKAGTVYGGTLTINPDRTGQLVVDKALKTFDGSETWYDYPSFEGFYNNQLNMKNGLRQDGISNMLADSKTAISGQKNKMWLGVNSTYFFAVGVHETMGSTVEEFKAFLAEHNLQLVYPLDTPITYQLTESEISDILDTLYGTNNIWTDVGTVDVEYPADTKLYIDNKFAELQALILEH